MSDSRRREPSHVNFPLPSSSFSPGETESYESNLRARFTINRNPFVSLDGFDDSAFAFRMIHAILIVEQLHTFQQTR